MSRLITGKVWGWTSCLLQTPFIEVHRISVNPGTFCSIHKHEHKWNMFFCLSGSLAIKVKKNDYDLIDTTIIHEDEWTTVKPGESHWFETIDGAEALEIYYLEPLSDDIVRESVGGVNVDGVTAKELKNEFPEMEFEPKYIKNLIKQKYSMNQDDTFELEN